MVEVDIVSEVPGIVVVEKFQGTSFVLATHSVVPVSVVVAAATAAVEDASSCGSIVEEASWQLEVHLMRGEDSHQALAGSGTVSFVASDGVCCSSSCAGLDLLFSGPSSVASPSPVAHLSSAAFACPSPFLCR